MFMPWQSPTSASAEAARLSKTVFADEFHRKYQLPYSATAGTTIPPIRTSDGYTVNDGDAGPCEDVRAVSMSSKGLSENVLGARFLASIHPNSRTETSLHQPRPGTPVSPLSEEVFGDVLNVKPTRFPSLPACFTHDSEDEDADTEQKSRLRSGDFPEARDCSSKKLSEDATCNTIYRSDSQVYWDLPQVASNAANYASASATYFSPSTSWSLPTNSPLISTIPKHAGTYSPISPPYVSPYAPRAISTNHTSLSPSSSHTTNSSSIHATYVSPSAPRPKFQNHSPLFTDSGHATNHPSDSADHTSPYSAQPIFTNTAPLSKISNHGTNRMTITGTYKSPYTPQPKRATRTPLPNSASHNPQAFVLPQPVFCHTAEKSWGESSTSSDRSSAIETIRQFKDHIFGDCVPDASEDVFNALANAPHYFEIRVTFTLATDLDGRSTRRRRKKADDDGREVELSRFFVPSAMNGDRYLEIHPRDLGAGLNPSRGRLGQMERYAKFVKYGCSCMQPRDAFHKLTRTVFLLRNHQFRGVVAGAGACESQRRPRALPRELWVVSGACREWGLSLSEARSVWEIWGV